MTPFPWEHAMQFGFGVLRLAPKDFWAMTPRELAHAIRALQGDVAEPLARESLANLMMCFPDEVAHGR